MTSKWKNSHALINLFASSGGNVLGQLAAIFELLGSPDESTWPDVRHLPDFGKLHFDEKPRQPLETVIPRAKESPYLLHLLENLIVLDPSKRYSTQQALEDGWFKTLTNKPIDRKAMQTELIPISLQESILLSNPERDLSVASKKALDMATLKRTFLAGLHQWPDSQSAESKDQSVEKRCRQLCPNLASLA